MASLIRDGAHVPADDWRGPLLSIAELNAMDELPEPVGVVLQPEEPPAAIKAPLERIGLVAIHFPTLMDGRGFSYARELRERGYAGEIRATGEFMPDQMHYLLRCGFNAFELADGVAPEEALACLHAFSDGYQGDATGRAPLFRRRRQRKLRGLRQE